MKKIATLAFALMLAAGMSFAQDTGGDKAPKNGAPKSTAGKKATKAPAAKAHKGGKKGKKSSGGTSTPAPK